MPGAPGIIERVNYVKEFICDPCEAPFIVYVETFLPAFGELVLEWYGFSLDDIIRGYFRPAGLVSHGHKRRLADRKKKRKKNKLIRALNEIIGFEPGEVIAKNLPLQQKMRFRKVSDGVKHLWIIDGIIQRAFYYWMVIDLVTEFAYKWTSLLMKTEYCQAKSQFLLLTQNAKQYMGGPPGNYSINIGETIKKRGNVVNAVTEIGLPGPGTVIVAGRLAPYEPAEAYTKGYIKLIGKSVFGREFLSRSGDVTVSNVETEAAIAKAQTDYRVVQPVFVIEGDESTLYSSWLVDLTCVAIGHR